MATKEKCSHVILVTFWKKYYIYQDEELIDVYYR